MVGVCLPLAAARLHRVAGKIASKHIPKLPHDCIVWELKNKQGKKIQNNSI